MLNFLRSLFTKSEPKQELSQKKPGTSTLPVEVTELDIDTLTRTLYGEARGESEQGALAVAHVVINRWRKPGWWSRNKDTIKDDTIAAVCRNPYQFSCWLPNDPNYLKLINLTKDAPEYVRLRAIAEKAFLVPDTTGGATHYYAKYIKAPNWTKHATFTVEYGVHKFYKDVG